MVASDACGSNGGVGKPVAGYMVLHHGDAKCRIHVEYQNQ